ncbi:MAG: ATP synthase F1 subunit delta [Clostridia bacterium]|nr:ATP synthase F1 subunit delta [Clostridia bacterium]
MKEIVKEYGGGLYELAVDEGLEEVLLEQTRALRGILEPSYLHLLTTPGISKTERVGLAAEALDGRVHPYLANFVKIMVERGNAYEIPGCFDEYEQRYFRHHGIIRAKAESAVPLTDAQREKLTARLEARTGKKIELTCVVVPGLIGGIRLSFDNRLIDDTAHTKLKTIAGSLADAVL